MAFYNTTPEGMRRSSAYAIYAIDSLGGIDIKIGKVYKACGIEGEEKRRAYKNINNMIQRGYVINDAGRGDDRCFTLTEKGAAFLQKESTLKEIEHILKTLDVPAFKKVPRTASLPKAAKKRLSQVAKTKPEPQPVVEPQIELSLSDAANTAMDSIAAIIQRDKAHNDAMKKMFITAGELLHNSELLESAIAELRARTGTTEPQVSIQDELTE